MCVCVCVSVRARVRGFQVSGPLPGHHATEAGPLGAAHQEPHAGVGHCIPGPAHEQNDGRVEGIQLTTRKKDQRQINTLMWNSQRNEMCP